MTNFIFVIKQGRKHPLDMPKRMIERRKREEREKERERKVEGRKSSVNLPSG